jgi:hypothetical protein
VYQFFPEPISITLEDMNIPNFGFSSNVASGLCPPSNTMEIQTLNKTVYKPDHYEGSNNIDCLQAIEAQLSEEEYKGFLKGNIVKYIWREKSKGQKESLEKARFYLNTLLNLD